MNDIATSLRVIAAYKAGEDLADRLATAVAVQQSMSVALMKAADEIERLRNDLYAKNDEKHGVTDTARATLTAEEREAINVARIELNALHCFEEHHSHTLLKLLERTQ
jgi:hypothetical protein